jgi:hypothetical protein
MGTAYPSERIGDRMRELAEAVKERRDGAALLLLNEIYCFSELHPRKWQATLRARCNESERKAVIAALKLYAESGV